MTATEKAQRYSAKSIILRLERLEAAVFGSDKKSQLKKAAEEARSAVLSTHILRLRDQGFFKESRTAIEVHEKLRSHYQCEPNRVAMALLRLQRDRKLRKSSKVVGKRKRVAYAW